MNNYLSKTKPFVLVLILSIVLINTSCNKEEKGEMPNLPPVETMVMDFSDFQSAPVASKGMEKVTEFTYDNFTYAYNNVTFWNAFTTISLVIPVSSYAYALQQEPVYLGNNKWEWSYNFTLGQEQFTATLRGERLDNEKFSMEMNIALTSLPLVKFKYFDGICRYDHTHAEWNLYKNVEATSVKVLEVEWTKDFVTEEATLLYTYVEPGQVETNSSILWTYTPDADYDAGYYITLSEGNVDIEWNTTSKAGHVMSPSYFEDQLWHCWNDLLQDIECPQ